MTIITTKIIINSTECQTLCLIIYMKHHNIPMRLIHNQPHLTGKGMKRQRGKQAERGHTTRVEPGFEPRQPNSHPATNMQLTILCSDLYI